MPTDEKNPLETPGGNRFWCSDGIARYFINAPVDESEAEQLRDSGWKCIESGYASSIIIDIQQSTEFSSAARKIWVEFLKHPKIEKTAIFGGNVFVRTLASFVIAASQKKNIKFFTTEDEAMEWLTKS